MKKFRYSKHDDGAYCRACAFFASDKLGDQNTGQFVITAFKAWIKMSSKSSEQSKKQYHNTSMTKMEEFLTRYQNPIGMLLETEVRKIVEKCLTHS